jgi:Na+-translocating ferredoxin:NAD+ oxidoreductase RnfC subunit
LFVPRREINFTRNLFVFIRDEIGAPSNALVANLATISRNQPKNLTAWLAAKRAVSVRH